MKKKLLFAFLFSVINMMMAHAQENRWKINESGGISWYVNGNKNHTDHIEMSGKYISSVIYYGVNSDQSFYINRKIVWPMLRTIPNDTHASLIRSFNTDIISMISINEKNIEHEKVNEIRLDGKITVKSTVAENVHLTRVLFPSTDLPVFCEKYTLTNNSDKAVEIEIPELKSFFSTLPEKGVDGSYRLEMATLNAGTFLLQPGKNIVFYQVISGRKAGQAEIKVDVETELSKRQGLIHTLWDHLVLETPDTVLNKAFAFAKIRAAESIYQTKGGPMHSPGGLRYYAAIWANDQAEYINPFFPYLGYGYGNESALNAYRQFARFMNNEYKPLPSSIIAEGTDIWNGAGDRGDAAMIAYGAARFCLSLGDRKVAEELWPLIEWCLEYNKRKLNKEGVVTSNSDELEGRFPSGKANLCTSSLYYDALVSASYLGKSLGKEKKQLSTYKTQADALKINIEKYFGAKVMGFDTYQYYEGNEKLRAWICIPLTVNIFNRKQGTIDALFSPELWTSDGLATQAGDKTFWDRATLYALRGVFAAGERERGLTYLQYYSNRRLLGDHVPYPVEAYPEGDQRQLSAESGLYCRIYTEGLFGIRPTGLNSFTITPQLPAGWDYMRLNKVSGFQKEFDIEVKREKDTIRLVVKTGEAVVCNKLIQVGTVQHIKL